MLAMPYILAAAEDPVVKLILGAVFFLFWGISSIASILAKKKQQEKRDRLRQELERGAPVIPAPMPVARRRISPPPAPRPMAKPAKVPPLKRAPVIQQRASAMVVPKAVDPIAASFPQAPQPAPATTAAAARRTVSVNATALHAWLKPATLRQQFMLTEVLQPPVGLRE